MIERWQRDLTRNTVYTYTHHLAKLLREIDREHGTSVANELKQPAHPVARLNLVTSSQLQKMLAFARPHLAVAIRLMREAGLRWAEALRASPACLEESGHLRITTKGKHHRRIALPASLAGHLRTIATQQDTRSYVEILRGHHIGSEALRQEWARVRRQANLPTTIHPHDLRRTAAVELFERTHDILAVKKFLGHESVTTTDWYLKAYEAKKENHQ